MPNKKKYAKNMCRKQDFFVKRMRRRQNVRKKMWKKDFWIDSDDSFVLLM